MFKSQARKEMVLAKWKIEGDLIYDVESLINNAKGLQHDMEILVRKLQKDGGKANINELGEVQNRGWIIDGLCRKIVVQNKILELLQSL